MEIEGGGEDDGVDFVSGFIPTPQDPVSSWGMGGVYSGNFGILGRLGAEGWLPGTISPFSGSRAMLRGEGRVREREILGVGFTAWLLGTGLPGSGPRVVLGAAGGGEQEDIGGGGAGVSKPGFLGLVGSVAEILGLSGDMLHFGGVDWEAAAWGAAGVLPGQYVGVALIGGGGEADSSPCTACISSGSVSMSGFSSFLRIPFFSAFLASSFSATFLSAATFLFCKSLILSSSLRSSSLFSRVVSAQIQGVVMHLRHCSSIPAKYSSPKSCQSSSSSLSASVLLHSRQLLLSLTASKYLSSLLLLFSAFTSSSSS